MIIQAIRQTGGERMALLLDDGQEIPTTLGIVTELRLFSGKTLDDAQLQRIRTRSAAALAREQALNLLSLRPHSRKELQDKLVRKGTDPEAAEAAVEWLTEHGYLDDAAYAAAVARHYAKKGYGARRISSELYRRGVARELWDEALGELPGPEGEIDRFLRSRLKHPEDPAEVRRVSAALSRRGFRWEEIRAALNRAEVPEE